MNKTLALIRPECVQKKLYPEILRKILDAGFEIKEMKMIKMSPELAEEFFDRHQDKIFFPKLIENLTSGPLIALILEKKDADVINEWRKFIGNTDPQKANPGTLRRMFGISFEENGFYGSNSPENAIREIEIIFPY